MNKLRSYYILVDYRYSKFYSLESFCLSRLEFLMAYVHVICEVIYELYDTVVAALESDLDQEEELVEKGKADVKAVFKGRDGNVAGAEIVSGLFTRGERVQVFRKGKKVGEGKIRSIRRFKEEVKEPRQSFF